MDTIKQAIELARASEIGTRRESEPDKAPIRQSQIRQAKLDQAHLEQTRIVAHGVGTPHGRCYDMLRTQVLQEMDKNGWQFLAVTSPTSACGKTVTTCNLAMSIAKLPERNVLLVDLDMRKPMVGEYLGLGSQSGVLKVLEERNSLVSSVVQTSIGPSSMLVLPGQAAGSTSSEWLASKDMANLLQALKREFRSHIMIFDLPPMLIGDDVISILPRMDAVLLVAGVGATSVEDIKECQRHLKGSNLIRVVVNKVTDATDDYYAYY